METRSPRRIVRAAVLTLALATLIGPLAANPAAAANSGEKELRTYVNEARDERGARELGMRKFLVRAARRHSRQMASSGQLVHSTDLASYVGSRSWSIIGENIGYGPSMDVLHDAFMDSPPHRKNQLNRRFRNIGVGMAVGDDGQIWVTVLFLG
ncbi:MAG: CAP domain-containing protein [Actinomycetota bacterium]